MRRTSFLSVAAIMLLLAMGLLLWAATPHASEKPIGLSDDGVTFRDRLPESLFAGVAIVPGESVTRSFWVKNRQMSAGNLAVALTGVTGSDPAMVAALSANAKAGMNAGPDVAFLAAKPCHTLVSAIALAAGAVTRVDVTLELSGWLPSRALQGSLGAFDLRVSMASTDIAQPDGCGAVAPSSAVSTTQGPPKEFDTVVVSGAAAGSVPGDSRPADFSGDSSGVPPIDQPNPGPSLPLIYLVTSLVALVLGGTFAAWRWSRNRGTVA